MPINVSTITPASLKAKEVATEEYVDTAVSNFPATDAEWQVRVQSALDADATIINGSKITTGSIDASLINTGTLNSSVINGQSITGAKIYGAYIEGALIKSSWIDTTGTGYMTEWKQFTPTTVPAEYVSNFIHSGTELFVDEKGYVRIQGFPVVYSVPASKTNTVADGVEDVIDIKVNIGAYDSYTSSNVYRAMTSTPKFSSTEHVLLSFT